MTVYCMRYACAYIGVSPSQRCLLEALFFVPVPSSMQEQVQLERTTGKVGMVIVLAVNKIPYQMTVVSVVYLSD